jgi:GAF domain-containing protein
VSLAGLPESVRSVLASGDFARAVEAVAAAYGAVTATLHRADPRARVLVAVAAFGLPESLREATARIPFGKGMAGLCAERLEPVTVCNLQTDTSGVARPGAKLTGVEGAIVVPLFEPGTAELAGTLGVGKAGAHDYTEAEIAALEATAREIAHAFARHVA